MPFCVVSPSECFRIHLVGTVCSDKAQVSVLRAFLVISQRSYYLCTSSLDVYRSIFLVECLWSSFTDHLTNPQPLNCSISFLNPPSFWSSHIYRPRRFWLCRIFLTGRYSFFCFSTASESLFVSSYILPLSFIFFHFSVCGALSFRLLCFFPDNFAAFSRDVSDDACPLPRFLFIQDCDCGTSEEMTTAVILLLNRTSRDTFTLSCSHVYIFHNLRDASFYSYLGVDHSDRVDVIYELSNLNH